ncbi:hypothetical protein CBOM_08130 [Ceraceosorus bombacis]|uniref:Uncharacterized protein n=1 Tax=Ceraceosorus bombacis TaxID=401625 RepID=A0A0P1B9X1_9BASI|nr:hypothetical protein CBOM_08130 [Ceraceosorus bombacis]
MQMCLMYCKDQIPSKWPSRKKRQIANKCKCNLESDPIVTMGADNDSSLRLGATWRDKGIG